MSKCIKHSNRCVGLTLHQKRMLTVRKSCCGQSETEKCKPARWERIFVAESFRWKPAVACLSKNHTSTNNNRLEEDSLSWEVENRRKRRYTIRGNTRNDQNCSFTIAEILLTGFGLAIIAEPSKYSASPTAFSLERFLLPAKRWKRNKSLKTSYQHKTSQQWGVYQTFLSRPSTYMPDGTKQAGPFFLKRCYGSMEEEGLAFMR